MKTFRMGRNTTEHYSSFQEMGKAWGCKPITKNEEKLKKQQEKFLAHKDNKCKACGESMTWIGGNQMVCMNEKCKGIKIEKEDAEGNKMITYVTSYTLLDEKLADYAQYLFSQLDKIKMITTSK